MRFIGCKENLLNFIEAFVKNKNIKNNIFCDLFAGTVSVSKHFKRFGCKIISSDLLYFSYVLQKTYIEQNQYPQFLKLIKHLEISPVAQDLFYDNSQNAKTIINFLNNLNGIEGFIFNNYSPEGTQGQKHVRKYFTGENAKKIDVIRDQIEKWKNAGLLTEDEFFFLLGSLIEAVPFVANISGTYAAFLKNWDKRAFKKIKLRVPEIIESHKKHKAFNMNGLKVLDNIKEGIDILYLDPPYNERQYAPNYHVLETVARWDNPVVKGVTGMRTYADQKSEFCNPKTGLKALEEILKKDNFNHLILSYNDEGIMPEKEILNLFNKYGKVEVVEQSYQRYKSNGNGDKKNRVKEKLYHLELEKGNKCKIN